MADLIKRIRTASGDLQIDYESLANLPTTDKTLTVAGQAADAKAVADALVSMNTRFSNPNLLINSDFRNPVNQRGVTTYQEAPDWTYCIDRWKYFNQMTVEVLTGAVKFASHGTGQSWFMQEFEKELPADNYTLSVKVSSVSGTCDMKFENSSGVQAEQVINSTGVTTLSFNGAVNAVSFELDGDGSHLTIEWVKLEQGTIATPFVQRLKAEELALCQRYYEKRTVIFLPYGGENPTTYYLAVNGSDHRVTKCQLPKITATALTDHNNVAADVSFVSATQTKDNIRLMTVSAACDKYLLRSDIEFDAEIY